MRKLRGKHQAGQIHGGPLPTAASCLAEGKTAKRLVPEQKAVRTRMNLKLFWIHPEQWDSSSHSLLAG